MFLDAPERHTASIVFGRQGGPQQRIETPPTCQDLTEPQLTGDPSRPIEHASPGHRYAQVGGNHVDAGVSKHREEIVVGDDAGAPPR